MEKCRRLVAERVRASLVLMVLLMTLLSSSSSWAKPAQPICDGRFHFVSVPSTKCFDGTETGYEYACLTGSAASPLLIYLNGGGACFDGDSCNCKPNAQGVCQDRTNIAQVHYDKSESNDGQLWADSDLGKIALLAGPTSPFNQGWNVIRVPYCTADDFGGQAVNHYTASDGTRITAHQEGYKNITASLRDMKSLFPEAPKVAFTGGSAGGIGVDCNLSQVRSAWPQARLYELNNAGTPFEAAFAPLISDVARTLGAWHPGPHGQVVGDTCPILAPPGTTAFDLSLVVAYNRQQLADVRKAFTDDYSDYVMEAIACGFNATKDPGGGSCNGALTGILNDVLDHVITTQDPNYRVYYHTGSCHSEREQDGNSDPGCDFDQMQQGGAFYNQWVNEWINDSATWPNVR